MFGKILRKLIIEKYDSLVQFSETCGISTGHLNDILNGRSLPKLQKLEIILNNLSPLSEENKKLLMREWAFDKTDGILRDDYNNLINDNKNMLEVLKEIKNEEKLLNENKELKEYEKFYNLFFENLDVEESKKILNSMLKELKLISLEKGNVEKYKEKFKQIENLIDNM